MEPITVLVLGGAAAAAAFLVHKKRSLAGQVEGALPGVVDSLTQGQTYAVMMTLAAQDGRGTEVSRQHPGSPATAAVPHQAIGTVDMATASAVIKATYEQLGFKFLAPPTLRDEGEISDFLHKNPSIWFFTAQWTRNDLSKPTLPPWALSHSFVTLPVQ